MSTRPRGKMDRETRAKQFLPFAALKGFEEALRAREHIVVEKSELSEERLEELDAVFKELKPGMMVECVFYKRAEENYIKLRGMLARVDESARVIRIVNTTINFEDIYDIIIET